MRRPKSLRDLLLAHQLIFILLVTLAGAAGGIGIHLWDRASHESQRINLLIQEIQQTRGDLYRQMKELFDAYFLADPEARNEYDAYTKAIEKHFVQLHTLAIGREEQAAVYELQASYTSFASETSSILDRHPELSGEALQKTLNTDLESVIFRRFENVSKNAELLLGLKQQELAQRLEDAKHTSMFLLAIPILLALMLLLFSRLFLKRAIVRPIEQILHATTEISAGRLEHKVPEAGAAELAELSRAINLMAEDLKHSQEALIRTEKQAAQGLLVPMLAHNIRNPLASIRATAQVTDSAELDRDTRDSLTAIISTVDRLERWTGSLLAYLLPLKPHYSETSLGEIIAGALVPLQQKLREKSIALKQPAWGNQEDRIFTDGHLLEQALYNLLLNATEASSRESLIEIFADLDKDSVRLTIADRGSGMPFTPDPHSVSPGPSTKRFGTGLGIPFCIKVCEELGGSIIFKARDDGGTLVEIELPRNNSVTEKV